MGNVLKDPSSNRACLQQSVKDGLRSKGVRMTRPREAIIEAVFSTEEHFHAESLWNRVREIEPGVSLTTVYRTLRLMVEHDFLGLLDLDPTTQHFDPNAGVRPRHYHVICSDCQKVIEFEDPGMREYEKALMERLGFEAEKITFQVTARCRRYKSGGGCEGKFSTGMP